jgi:hypothetical protein
MQNDNVKFKMADPVNLPVLRMIRPFAGKMPGAKTPQPQANPFLNFDMSF